ncbi:MAG TPA: hypothetical protein VEF04_04045, partial [Blastocatellia bacterium]|nr:hypothetical protein [Blastocatellia bacterium]
MFVSHLVLLLLLVVLSSSHAANEDVAASLQATIRQALENEQLAAAQLNLHVVTNKIKHVASMVEGMESEQAMSARQLTKTLLAQMALMKAQMNTFREQMKVLNMQSTTIQTYSVDELMAQLENGTAMTNSDSDRVEEEGEESASFLHMKQALLASAECDGDDLNCQFASADAATCALKTSTSAAKNYISQLNSKFSLLDTVGKTLSAISLTGTTVSALLYVATKLPYVGTFFSAVNTVFKSIVDAIKSATNKVSSLLNNGVLRFKSIMTNLGTILIGISFLPKLTAMVHGGGTAGAFDSLMELLSFNCFPEILQGLSLNPKSIVNSVKTVVSVYIKAVGEASSLLKDASNFLNKLLDPISKALSKIGGVFDVLEPVMDFFKPIQKVLETRFTWKMFGKKVLDFSIQDLIDDFNDIMKYIKKIPGLGFVIDKIESWVKSLFQPFIDFIQKKLKLPSPADLGFPDLPSLDGIPLADLSKKLTALTDVQKQLSNYFDQLTSTVTSFATKLVDKVKVPDVVEDIVDDVSDFVNCNDNTKSSCIVAAVKKIVPGLELNMTQVLVIAQALHTVKSDVTNAISNIASGITCVDGDVNVTNPLVYALSAMNGPTCGNPTTTISFCKDITVSDALKSTLTALVKPLANLITGMIPKSGSASYLQKSN